MSFLDEYAAYCAEHGTPERLELLLPDINAVLRGKWLPGDQARKLPDGAVRLPLSTYAPNIMGHEVCASGYGSKVGDPDGYLKPLPGTLRRMPWVGGNIAQVFCDMEDEEGAVTLLSPRLYLTRVLDRLAAHGWTPVIAPELEFYILRQRARSEDAPQPPTRTPQAQNYDMELLHRAEPMLNDILSACEMQGIPTGSLIAEYGPGQFEVNFKHTDNALGAADNVLMFRRLVRAVVDSHGMEATFMAKPYAEYPGNGMHVHVSLIDAEGRNIFDTGTEEMSPLLRHAVGGTLATMRDMQTIFCPHLNSIRRFGPGSFAPSAPEWGSDHRGAAVRIPEDWGPAARLEHRICGADVNPYLALAAILGGVLHGIENQIDPGPPLEGDEPSGVEPLEADWAGTVDRFERSAFAREIFGEEYCNVYTHVRRDEIAQLTTIISPVEYRYYLSRL